MPIFLEREKERESGLGIVYRGQFKFVPVPGKRKKRG